MLMATDLPGILIVDDNEDNRYTLLELGHIRQAGVDEMGRPLYELTDAGRCQTDAGRASHARDKGRLHQPSCLEARLARARGRAVRTARSWSGIVSFRHLPSAWPSVTVSKPTSSPQLI